MNCPRTRRATAGHDTVAMAAMMVTTEGLKIATPAFVAPTKVDVNLPAGYDASPSRRWPVTYFTAGTMNRRS